MPLKTIPVHRLKIGMYVEDLDRPWLDTPFLFHSKKIKRHEDIDKLVKYGIKTVTIDTDKGLDCEEQPSILDINEKAHLTDRAEDFHPSISETGYTDPIGLDEELPRAKEIKSNVSAVIKDVFNDVRMGKSFEVKEIKAQVSQIVDSVFRNRDALLCLANLKDYDDYTFVHSVNVCLLAVSFGRHLGLSKERLEDIGLGGLLHDIGKTRIPEEILNKPGRYTEEEYKIMRRHVTFGMEILRGYEHISQEAMLLPAQHHERYNGTGYPNNLYGEKISLIGQIGSLSDVYDALTYNRVYHKASSCHSAIKRLYEWADTLFNRTLVEKFIKCIGIYPFGSFVELNTGQCGIVVSVNHQALLRPNVLIILDKEKNLQSPVMVDLSKETDDRGHLAYSIERELDPSAFGVNINQYI